MNVGDLIVAQYETWIYDDFHLFNTHIIATIPEGGIVVHLGDVEYNLHRVMYDGVVGWANGYDLGLSTGSILDIPP